jgi:transposase
MREPDEVAAMIRLKALGWGVRRIAQELGCSHTTVRRYLAAGGWTPYRTPERASALEGLEGWLAERLRCHRGNADVVRQELEREHGLKVSLRTIQRAVSPHRRELVAEARATVRFETPPGHQLQVDFGELRAPVDGESGRVYLFVATLGYSRRPYVQAFRHERQSAWLDGIEGAFRHFGGVTTEVLVDNAKALVTHHDAATREVTFNGRFLAFARYWGFRPRACAPYRARSEEGQETVQWTVSPTNGQGRARRWVCQAQRDRGPPLRLLGGDGGASRALDAGDRRPAHPRHDGRGAAGALCT